MREKMRSACAAEPPAQSAGLAHNLPVGMGVQSSAAAAAQCAAQAGQAGLGGGTGCETRAWAVDGDGDGGWAKGLGECAPEPLFHSVHIQQAAGLRRAARERR